MRKILVLAAAGIIAFCSCLMAEEELQKGLLFYASFDNGVEADIAKGNPVPVLKGNLVLDDGCQGKAFLTGENFVTQLQYENEGNFDITRGTISLWIKPIDWLAEKGTTSHYNIFMNGNPGKGYFGLHMARQHRKLPYVQYYCIQFPDRKVMGVNYMKAGEWANGLWHHLVFTWGDREVKFYVDGNLSGGAQLERPFSPSELHSKSFFLGTKAEEHTAIDEVRIWNRTLDAPEISRLYQREHP